MKLIGGNENRCGQPHFFYMLNRVIERIRHINNPYLHIMFNAIDVATFHDLFK